MPELPEVETIRRDLVRELVGARVERAVATGMRTVRRHGDPAVLASAVDGRSVVCVARRGKYPRLRLAEGGAVVVRLRMSGQLLLRAADDPVVKRTHVVCSLRDGRELRFVDPRTFGEVFVATGDPPPELAALGIDPIEDAMS